MSRTGAPGRDRGPAPAPTRTLVRGLARGLGELLVTAGALVLLFAAYQLFWTDLGAAGARRELTGELRRSWDGAGPSPDPVGSVDPLDRSDGRAPAAGRPPAQAPAPDPPATGEALALLHIPRLGAGWVQPVVQGVGIDQLTRGVGHYAETALPGQIGNFAVAGHRVTHGRPLTDLDRLRPGDAVVVETGEAWFTYAVRAAPVVVAPTATGAIAPVPFRVGEIPAERLLTLTTCHPRWSSEKRMIVHATLVAQRPRAAGSPPVLAHAGPEGS